MGEKLSTFITKIVKTREGIRFEGRLKDEKKAQMKDIRYKMKVRITNFSKY